MSNKTVLNNGQRQWQHTWIEDGVVKGYVLNPKQKATVPSEVADSWLKSSEVVLVVDSAVEEANRAELEALRAENAELKAQEESNTEEVVETCRKRK